MSSTVISCREYSEEATTSESFKSIHYTLVSSQDEVNFVIFQESFDSIRSKFNNVTSTIWISNKVWLNTKFTITISWITPKDINYKLLLNRTYLVDNLKWSSNLFNLLKTNKSTSNTSMQANNSVFNNACKWKPVEEIIDFIKD